MLFEKYFNIPVWVWIITIIILFVVFILPQKSSKPEIKSETTSKEDFTNSTHTKSKISIYNFNTTWCGWSRNFQPEWDLFMDYMKDPKINVNNIEVKDIKCDDIKCKDVYRKYNIPGYPYVIIDVDGVHEHYEGERKASELIKYMISKQWINA